MSGQTAEPGARPIARCDETPLPHRHTPVRPGKDDRASPASAALGGAVPDTPVPGRGKHRTPSKRR
jgi:hypothetical protein